jgi:hypothetical protein
MVAMNGLAFLLGLWGFTVTIVWIVIGWRAMKAHEKIADSVEYLARKKMVDPER